METQTRPDAGRMIGKRGTVRLLQLGPSDEGPLSRLFRDNAVPEVMDYFDPFPLDPTSARRLTHHRGRDRYWGIWLGTELVGLAMVRGWDGGHPEPTVGVFVDRGHQGQGIGKAAMRNVIEAMGADGEPLIRARVHEGNAASLRMFFAVGYREIGRGGGRVLLECGPARISQVGRAAAGGEETMDHRDAGGKG